MPEADIDRIYDYDPAYIADRHHIEGKVAKCDATIDKVSKALNAIITTAVKPVQ